MSLFKGRSRVIFFLIGPVRKDLLIQLVSGFLLFAARSVWWPNDPSLRVAVPSHSTLFRSTNFLRSATTNLTVNAWKDVHFTSGFGEIVNISCKRNSYHLTAIEQWTLNDWSRWEQWILFPENLNVSRDEVEGNIEIRGKQNSLFPKGPVIKWFVT